jgi:hypothetical protein
VTAVRDPGVDRRVRGLFEAFQEFVDPAEVTAVQQLERHVETPALPEATDVIDRSVLRIVDYPSIVTAGELPVVKEMFGVAWYVGQRGLSYFPLITRTPLSVHSFDWSPVAVRTPEFPTVQVSAVVLAGCGTPCIPIRQHGQLATDLAITYCTDPRCWTQPEPQPEPGPDLQTEN